MTKYRKQLFCKQNIFFDLWTGLVLKGLCGVFWCSVRMKKKRQSCTRFLIKPTNRVNKVILVALIALFSTVISSYAQDTSRDYGNYQYFDGSIFDGSGQEDPQFNDIRQGMKHLVIHVLFTRMFYLNFECNKKVHQ